MSPRTASPARSSGSCATSSRSETKPGTATSSAGLGRPRWEPRRGRASSKLWRKMSTDSESHTYMCPMQVSFIKLTMTPQIRREVVYKHVVQDIIIPLDELERSIDLFHNWFEVRRCVYGFCCRTGTVSHVPCPSCTLTSLSSRCTRSSSSPSPSSSTSTRASCATPSGLSLGRRSRSASAVFVLDFVWPTNSSLSHFCASPAPSRCFWI